MTSDGRVSGVFWQCILGDGVKHVSLKPPGRHFFVGVEFVAGGWKLDVGKRWWGFSPKKVPL